MLFMDNTIYSIVDDYDGDYVWDNKLQAFRAPKYPGEIGDNFEIGMFNNDKNMGGIKC